MVFISVILETSPQEIFLYVITNWGFVGLGIIYTVLEISSQGQLLPTDIDIPGLLQVVGQSANILLEL